MDKFQVQVHKSYLMNLKRKNQTHFGTTEGAKGLLGHITFKTFIDSLESSQKFSNVLERNQLERARVGGDCSGVRVRAYREEHAGQYSGHGQDGIATTL